MNKTIIGWRESVALPEWGIAHVVGKIDTGARSSAIDVASIIELPDDRVQFEVVFDRKSRRRRQVIEADIVRRTRVRSAHGTVHERIMIETTLRLGPVEKVIEIGLVCREAMLCRLLIGRRALEPEFAVDPGSRYVLGRPKRSGRRRKRGSS